jgi:hypothetical protein
LLRKALVRADSSGDTHEFITWPTARSRRLHYPVGMRVTMDTQVAIQRVLASGVDARLLTMRPTWRSSWCETSRKAIAAVGKDAATRAIAVTEDI